MHKIYHGTDVSMDSSNIFGLTMPIELDGMTDLFSQYTVNYPQQRNCLDIPYNLKLVE